MNLFDAFLCHRRKDGQPLALAIREHLRRKGVRIFMDVYEQSPGQFGSRLAKAISRSRLFVICETETFSDDRPIDNDWVKQEISWAKESRKPFFHIQSNGLTKLNQHNNYQKLENIVATIQYPGESAELTLVEIGKHIRSTLFPRLLLLAEDIYSYKLFLIFLFLGLVVSTFVITDIEKNIPIQKKATFEASKRAVEGAKKIQELEKKLKSDAAEKILFLIDTTGSMHGKLDSVGRHAQNIATSAKLGTEFIVILFADYTDAYVVKEWQRTTDTSAIYNAVLSAQLTDGGDYPEAAAKALIFTRELIQKESANSARLLVYTDAPDHKPEQFIIEVKRMAEGKIPVTLISCGVSPSKIGWRPLPGIELLQLQ